MGTTGLWGVALMIRTVIKTAQAKMYGVSTLCQVLGYTLHMGYLV